MAGVLTPDGWSVGADGWSVDPHLERRHNERALDRAGAASCFTS